jgi:predicted DNA binding CopG/RHH family protein
MYGVSQIQAYRYIQQAEEIKGKLPIPETSVVFTVKLPPTLINRVKKFARSKGMTISRVVRTALEEFLARKDHGKKGETS